MSKKHKSKIKKKKNVATNVFAHAQKKMISFPANTIHKNICVVVRKFYMLLTVIATVLVFYDVYVATFPEIRIQSSDISDPFLSPFVIKNNSHFFDMNEVTLQCYADSVLGKNGESLRSIESVTVVEHKPKKPTIVAGNQANIRCLIGDVMKLGRGQLYNAHIFVSAQYNILGIPMTSDKIELTWAKNLTPPQWVVGIPPD